MATSAAPSGLLGSLLARAQTEIRAAAGKLLGSPTQIEAARPLSQQLLYVGLQTPDDVAALLRLADAGYMYRVCDFFEEQRNRDCHLNTVCYRREHALATVDWQIVPASEKRRDLKIAAWVEEALKRMGDIDHREARDAGLHLHPFRDLTVHLNGAVIPGYAAAEVLYAKHEGRIVPAGALPIGARRFVYSQLDGSLRWFDALGGPPDNRYPGKDLLRDFAPGRFILHRPRINGAAGPREGLLRPLTWASLFRTWAIGDWLKLAELAWKPYRWGTYKPEAGDKDITALDEALQKLMAHGWTRIPDRTELHVQFPKNAASSGSGQHEALARFLGEEMSKVATGHTLTVEEGKKGTARTAGSAENVSHSVLEIDARAEEGTIQRQLIAPLVRANFGTVPMPRFVFVTELGSDITAMSDALAKLVEKAGLKGIPARWVRAMLGAPEPDVDEEVLGGELWKLPSEQEQPEPEEDDTEDAEEPEVTDEATDRALRNYRAHQALVAARLRRAS